MRKMFQQEETKALVLKAFDTLFNRRDYEKAAEFGRTITSSIAPTYHLVEMVCLILSAAYRRRCAMKMPTSWRRAIT